MKAIIIEDESRAVKRLTQLLDESHKNMEIIGVAESVKEGVDLLEKRTDVQLIFSDIQLGDGLSFEIFENVEVKCPIIFTTAFDQYAIEAFKTNGVDYLLKPIELNDLTKAIQKAEKM